MQAEKAEIRTTFRVFRFGAYEADAESGELRNHGTRMNLREQSFKVLIALLQRPGEVVTRESLQHTLWPDRIFVNFENSLNVVVAHLREVLGDSAEHPRYIETLPRRGYRFIAEVCAFQSAGPRSESAVRLLVLPFANLSGDASQDVFCDSVTDEITTGLAGLAPDKIAVIARTTAMRYKGSHKDVARIGRELRVEYVVEGAVRRRASEIGINLQLARCTDQTHVFAAKYAAIPADLFLVQQNAVMDVARSLGVTRGDDPRSRPTPDLAAYNEYIQGRRELGWGTSDAFGRAKGHLEAAIRQDPHFALAYDALAETYWYLGYFGYMRPTEAFSAGIIHAVRALELDNDSAATHALLAQFHKTVEYNWAEVHREMALALELDPNSPLVRMRHAVSELMPQGRIDEAKSELERALELDPLSFVAQFWLGIMLILSRRYDRALAEGRRMLQLDSTYAPAHFVMALACRYLGYSDEAIAEQQKAVELSKGSAAMLGWLGLMLARGGRQPDARGVLQQLQHMAETHYVPPTSRAWVYLGLGELDIAFEWLDRAVAECDQFMMPIKSYAFFDPIRSDPRFVLLLRKMKLDG